MPKDTFFNLPEDKRERLIGIALDEFADHAYSRASISRIVQKAGIAKGSVYQYFKDKKDLYLYLIELAGQVKLDFIQSRQAEVDWSDFFGGFASLLLLGSEFEFATPRHLKFAKLLRNMMTDETWAESYAKMKSMSQSAISGLVERAQESGQVRSDIPLDLILFFVNTLTTELGNYVASRLGLDLTALADELEKRSHTSEAKERSPGRHVFILDLDFTEIVRDFVSLMKQGLAPAPSDRRH